MSVKFQQPNVVTTKSVNKMFIGDEELQAVYFCDANGIVSKKFSHTVIVKITKHWAITSVTIKITKNGVTKNGVIGDNIVEENSVIKITGTLGEHFSFANTTQKGTFSYEETIVSEKTINLYTTFNPSEGLNYVSLSSTEVLVSGRGSCIDKYIVAPFTHDGKSVKGVASGAFTADKNILGYGIGNQLNQFADKGIYYVNSNAFDGCTNLIFFENSVSEPLLKHIILGNKFTEKKASLYNFIRLEDSAFASCGFEQLTMEVSDISYKNLLSIGNELFLSCPIINSNISFVSDIPTEKRKLPSYFFSNNREKNIDLFNVYGFDSFCIYGSGTVYITINTDNTNEFDTMTFGENAFSTNGDSVYITAYDMSKSQWNSIISRSGDYDAIFPSNTYINITLSDGEISGNTRDL